MPLRNKSKIPLTMAIIILAGFIFASIASYWVAQHGMQNQLERTRVPLIGENIYARLEQDLQRPVQIVRMLAHNTFLIEWLDKGESDSRKLHRYLQRLEEIYESRIFFTSARTARYYSAHGIEQIISIDDPQDQWYFAFIKSGLNSQERVETWNSDGQRGLNIFINHKVFDTDDELLGVVSIKLTLNTLEKRLQTYAQEFDAHLLLADETGLIHLQTQPLMALQNIYQLPLHPEAKDKLFTRELSSQHFNYQGEPLYLYSHRLPYLNWHLVIIKGQEAHERTLLKLLLVNIVMGIAFAVVISVLIYLSFRSYHSRLSQMAVRDKLTGLFNRQYFEPALEEAISAADAQDSALSLIMFDIDHFKQVNDTYGHACGDKVIQNISRICLEKVRRSDPLCRWGGEEFILMLPNCSLGKAEELAEEIRLAVEHSQQCCGGVEFKITISLGVAKRTPGESWQTLAERTDKALYSAKRKGRNCWEVAPKPE